jgi:KipI family sensor histidine kinase inhibitor
MNDRSFTVEPLSEDALLLRFGEAIDVEINARVHAAARALRDAELPGITDIAPAYTSLSLRFDPWLWWLSQDPSRLPHAILTKTIRTCLEGLVTQAGAVPDTRTDAMEIPVCYGGQFGPDLGIVAEHAGLSPEAVVARHTAGDYRVAMLGFMPGFAYLLGLDAALQLPRRTTPRTRVPAGSVAIGGAQTGIYPRELPGGWHLIGRTPRVLFDAAREPPALLAPGQRVRFCASDEDAFAHSSVSAP